MTKGKLKRVLAVAMMAVGAIRAEAASEPTRYHTTEVEGLKIFYREAGDPSKPTVLLLHGFPTSVAVGMVLADHPPHRSRRAVLPHRAPASGSDA